MHAPISSRSSTPVAPVGEADRSGAFSARALAAAALAGLVFGLGIAISGMGNPAKVINFFDPFGTFDPSLAFVMGGALAVAIPGYRLIFARMRAPAFDQTFHLPVKRDLDRRLILGSAVFGVGWGLSGFCPGGAVPALGFAPWPTLAFLGALAVGIAMARLAIARGIG
jgi:hypothetical protein